MMMSNASQLGRCVITGTEINPHDMMRSWILPPPRKDWESATQKLSHQSGS